MYGREMGSTLKRGSVVPASKAMVMSSEAARRAGGCGELHPYGQGDGQGGRKNQGWPSPKTVFEIR